MDGDGVVGVVDFFFFFVDDEDDVADVEDGFFFFFFLLPLLDGFFAASIHIMIPMYIVCMVSERVEKLVFNILQNVHIM